MEEKETRWSRFTAWWQKFKNRKVCRFLLNKYVIATVIFLLVIGFIDTNNIGQFFRNRATLKAQREQMEFYRREIASMEEKLEQLQSKKDSLEQFAREEYFYKEKDEDVYLLQGPSSSVNGSSE